MPDTDNLFEMRRFEALSNTVFGVAMTLLAYDLPKAGAFASTPDWSMLVQAYGGRLLSLALSFIVAGIFWLSHHRRLAQAPYARRGVVMLNIVFLLTIVVLPATNNLFSSFRLNSAVVVLYAGHLFLISGLNAFLWCLARPSGAGDHQVAASLFPVAVFLLAAIVGFFNPAASEWVMPLAFAAPFVGYAVWRRKGRAA